MSKINSCRTLRRIFRVCRTCRLHKTAVRAIIRLHEIEDGY
jgi:hypothetical protein